MGSEYRASAFYGLVFDDGENEGDYARDAGVAFPFVDDAHFAVAAKASVVVFDPEGDMTRPPQRLAATRRQIAAYDRALKAWCKAAGRRYRTPRWWMAGGWS